MAQHRNILLYLPFVAGIAIHCSSIPVGQPGEAAEKLAGNMLDAAGYKQWQQIEAVSFVFRGDEAVFWDKKRKLVEVKTSANLVQFSEVTGKSLCFEGERRLTNECNELTQKAIKRFYNNTFWINPAFHIMSPGSERQLVEGNRLLVKYASGGSTPGDTYVFSVDEKNRIQVMQMWVSILPIKGIRATFSEYREIAPGLEVAEKHKVGGMANVNLSEIQVFSHYPETGKPDRFEGLFSMAASGSADSLNRRN